MTHIRSLKLKGFKSFNAPAHIEFRPGFNCVLGANGSGKSNILDALSFGLGQLSSKTLRADNYSELIFKRKSGAQSAGAFVQMDLDNKSKMLPLNISNITLSRAIHPSGSTRIKLNKRNITRNEVLGFLAHAKISPEGHNIIMQGDVSRFVDMKPLERRQLIEEISGISIYEERKNMALKELDKVEEKLKEASIILKEKQTYIDELYEEKKEAERFRSFTNELQRAEATKIRFRLNKVNHLRNENRNILEKLEKDIKNTSSALKSKKKTSQELNKKIQEIETEIESKGGEEKLALQKQVEDLRVAVSSGQNLVENSRNELNKIAARSKQLGADLTELDKKIAQSKRQKTALESQRGQLKTKIAALKKSMGSDKENLKKYQTSLENLESQIDGLGEQKTQLSNSLGKLASQREVLFYKIKNAEKRLETIKANATQFKGLSRNKARFKKIIEELNRLSSRNDDLSFELGNLTQSKNELATKIATLRVSAGAIDELMKRDRAIKQLLTMRKKNKKIIGTVAELGKVPGQFSKALKVAAGGRMKNIVVADQDTAISCLSALKKTRSGVATFLPLNKLRPASATKPPKLAGVFGLATELIDYPKKYDAVFRYVFGNTLIVKDTGVARSLAGGPFKVITLEGDVFQRSGAITGGYVATDVGLAFESKELNSNLEKHNDMLSNLKKKIKSIEALQDKTEGQMLALRSEKAELEGTIEAFGKLDLAPPDEIESERKKLVNELTNLEKNKQKIKLQMGEMDSEISKLKAKKKRMNTSLNKIQFGEKSDQVAALEEQEHSLASELATVKANLESGQLQEKNNISRVLRQLAKEKTEFEHQIQSKLAEISNFTKTLQKLEAEEKEYYGKLKTLFKTKSAMREKLDKLNSELDANQDASTIFSEQKNELSVEKAKLESRISGLKEELAQIDNAESLPHIKSLNAASNRINELKHNLEEMGNVNMKALEIYEGLKKEYDKLGWRVSKLRSEKDETMNVIDEIEKKKKDSFMDTFDDMARHFKELYSKMTEKGHQAIITLEDYKNPFNGGVFVRLKQDSKYMNIASLSGGEKVIVALALIFAIQEFKPAPFYLLDEIDAALDNVNSEKVADLLKEYSKKAQIIMISHNDAIISAADYLYGVSMNKAGESKIVSLEL